MNANQPVQGPFDIVQVKVDAIKNVGRHGSWPGRLAIDNKSKQKIIAVLSA
jgi:hypothetical protein